MHLVVLVLPDRHSSSPASCATECVNAPDGAGCFPTGRQHSRPAAAPSVSMHLMVLGAS